ncbi:MAG: UDP-N-acetylglucosamine 2-epimerase (non-hydrolyzing) [Solirubrobacterales bacterium]
MQVVTLVGNRPQFVKAAAVSKLLRERYGELLVHSGQHYDSSLSAVFFEQLDLPAADVELGIGPVSGSDQIGLIMHAFEPILRDAEADAVMVYGDTNTTLAGALTAAKVGCPLVHVEAGMRSFDSDMPEERNRVIVDHLASLCLCSTATALENLAAEEIRGRSELVGDVMADVSLAMMPVARERSNALPALGLEPGEYLLVTAHRAGNVDDPARLERLVELLEALPAPAVFPVHPRTRVRLETGGLLDRVTALERLKLTPPLGYIDFLCLLSNARAVLTDSGGVQKEAYLAAIPCVTLREATEWVETVELGWNVLVGLDRAAALEALARNGSPREHPELYGGGSAGQSVVEAIERWGGANTQ